MVPRLVELLSDEDSTVRYFAVDALGRIGDRRALPALEKLAATESAHHYGRSVRDAAQEAIKRIRDSGAAGEP
jgi:HEAT repeat protein